MGISKVYTCQLPEEKEKILQTMGQDPRTLQMKSYIQHGDVSTYAHCIAVARTSVWLAEKLHFSVNDRALIRAAVLHDYYLYDWHEKGDHLHGYHHPAIAAENAGRDFGLTDKELQMIRSHMWPLTFFHPPTSREAWILCLADKICAAYETVRGWRHSHGCRP